MPGEAIRNSWSCCMLVLMSHDTGIPFITGETCQVKLSEIVGHAGFDVP